MQQQLPQNWRVIPGRDPERETRRLKSRFQAISRRYQRAIMLRKLYPLAKLGGIGAISGFAMYTGIAAFSPFSPVDTLKHLASVPNCAAAQMLGVAPARRGQPGYWPRHDADNDGIACEPWRRR